MRARQSECLLSVESGQRCRSCGNRMTGLFAIGWGVLCLIAAGRLVGRHRHRARLVGPALLLLFLLWVVGVTLFGVLYKQGS